MNDYVFDRGGHDRIQVDKPTKAKWRKKNIAGSGK